MAVVTVPCLFCRTPVAGRAEGATLTVSIFCDALCAQAYAACFALAAGIRIG